LNQVRGVDVIADIMQLPFTSALADFVWCHHVLDQVPDDHAALAELKRVLKSTTGDLVIFCRREYATRNARIRKSQTRLCRETGALMDLISLTD
jgi:ubiquinone/menaquinone biosynthesis C-methylase UbiE